MATIVKLERGKAGPSIDALTALVADDMVKVNQLILRHMQSSVELIPQLAGHIVAAGGKRLRPMLTLAAAKLCNYQPSSLAPLSSSR